MTSRRGSCITFFKVTDMLTSDTRAQMARHSALKKGLTAQLLQGIADDLKEKLIFYESVLSLLAQPCT